MSPAGIPMFYGAFDEKTVRAELYDPTKRSQIITVGIFETARHFKVVDLTRLPDLPSLFDTNNRHKRAALRFLEGFVRDLSAPIIKDGQEHIEYVPSQIVTEYFRKVFRTVRGEPVHGLIYQSSRKDMGRCCVLFFENEHCCKISRGWNHVQPGSRDAEWLGLRPGMKRVTPLRAEHVSVRNLWKRFNKRSS